MSKCSETSGPNSIRTLVAVLTEIKQAKWAENISTKCIFLVEFFNSLKVLGQSHIVLLVRLGRMMDILEAIFRTHGYRYSRPDLRIDYQGSGPMKITLLPSNNDPRDFNIEPASLVVAFDSTFVNEPWVNTLRKDSMNPQRLVPMAHLVVTHSIEHQQLCLTKDMDRSDRNAVLVSWLSYTREDIGKLGSGYPSPDIAAKSLAEFVAGMTREWPLLPMPTMEQIELPVMDATEGQVSGSTTQSYDMVSSSVLQPASKRPLVSWHILLDLVNYLSFLAR